MATLTDQQRKVFEFIKRYTIKHLASPRLEDISTHMKFSGRTGAICHVNALERKGLVLRRGRRFIHIIGGIRCPHCGSIITTVSGGFTSREARSGR